MKTNEPNDHNNRQFAKPQPGEYHEYYYRYINLVPDVKVSELLTQQPEQLEALLSDLDPDETLRIHEPYAWTLKQVVGHMIDCERVFAMRLLRLGVQDALPIPGINSDEYVAAQPYNDCEMKSLLFEFRCLRQSSICLAERLTESALTFLGTASDQPTSARSCLYILAGHVDYHLAIIRKRLA